MSVPDRCLSFYFKLVAQILRIPVYLSYQFCKVYVFDVIQWGHTQIIKIYVNDVTSHQWLVSPQLCITVITHAYKAHRHKTLFYQTYSHKRCIRGKKISI